MLSDLGAWRLRLVPGRFSEDVTGCRCPGRCGCIPPACDSRRTSPAGVFGSSLSGADSTLLDLSAGLPPAVCGEYLEAQAAGVPAVDVRSLRLVAVCVFGSSSLRPWLWLGSGVVRCGGVAVLVAVDLAGVDGVRGCAGVRAWSLRSISLGLFFDVIRIDPESDWGKPGIGVLGHIE